MPTLSSLNVYDLAYKALIHHGADQLAADSLARSITATEEMGISSHGLMYLPIYCQHLDCGKVNRAAKPSLETQSATSFRANADNGFAHPAIDLGFAQLIPAAKEHGIAALAVHQSYNCGVLGYHVERLANAGLVGLGFTNAPASIAPIGGRTPVIGTNPFALAVPDANNEAAFVIDQSASTIAKSEIMKRSRAGESIPEGWAFDAEGNPTTDPDVALKGSMAPSGGYKGFGMGLLVEVFAAMLSGATLGKDASPFSGTAGGPPATGQFFIAVNPETFSGGMFGGNLEGLCAAIEGQDGARLPGSRRKKFRDDQGAIEIPETLAETISKLME